MICTSKCSIEHESAQKKSVVRKFILGFTASDVKQKLGAIGIPQVSMIQMKDHYNLSVLSLFSGNWSDSRTIVVSELWSTYDKRYYGMLELR